MYLQIVCNVLIYACHACLSVSVVLSWFFHWFVVAGLLQIDS